MAGKKAYLLSLPEFAAVLLDHYRDTLKELREVGYLPYATRQLRPYVRASIAQFSPTRSTITQRLPGRTLLRDDQRASQSGVGR